MIFRRENRGESFQRQISDLRHQQTDEATEEDDPHFDDEYELDEPSSTSRFSTDPGTPPEGISFPAPRSEQPRPVAEDPSPVPDPAPQYQESTRWQPQHDSATSIIAANSHWNGTLKTESSLRVHGKADGELHSASDLYVAEGAEVDAELHADSVVVAGLVRGRIEARSRLEILPQGEVTGDVRAPKLVVHEGATISGQLKMTSGEDQSDDGVGSD